MKKTSHYHRKGAKGAKETKDQQQIFSSRP